MRSSTVPTRCVNDAVGDGRAHDLMIETYRLLVSLPSAPSTLLASIAGDAAARPA